MMFEYEMDKSPQKKTPYIALVEKKVCQLLQTEEKNPQLDFLLGPKITNFRFGASL